MIFQGTDKACKVWQYLWLLWDIFTTPTVACCLPSHQIAGRGFWKSKHNSFPISVHGLPEFSPGNDWESVDLIVQICLPVALWKTVYPGYRNSALRLSPIEEVESEISVRRSGMLARLDFGGSGRRKKQKVLITHRTFCHLLTELLTLITAGGLSQWGAAYPLWPRLERFPPHQRDWAGVLHALAGPVQRAWWKWHQRGATKEGKPRRKAVNLTGDGQVLWGTWMEQITVTEQFHGTAKRSWLWTHPVLTACA